MILHINSEPTNQGQILLEATTSSTKRHISCSTANKKAHCSDIKPLNLRFVSKQIAALCYSIL